MFNYSFKYLFIILVFIILCFMGLVFSLNSIDGFTSSENVLSSDDFLSSGFVWPTPRL